MILKYIKNNYNNIKEIFKKRKIKSSIISLFFLFLALLTISITFVLMVCIVLSIIFSLKAIKKNQKLGFINIILCFMLIVIKIFIYFQVDKKIEDPYGGTNIMLGSWQYNESGGTYQFEKNKTYTQYVSDNKKDNFCYGTYKYEYGYETKDGKMIRKDVDYFYYYLVLSPKKCIFNNLEDTSTESKNIKKMIFGYGRADSKRSIIINTATDIYNILTKKE